MEVAMRRRGILLCLIGPAGGGKTSHGEQLLKENPRTLAYSISATSRPPRTGEQDGVHYHFLSRDEFLRRVNAGEFFEHEEVHGKLYGTLKRTIDDSIASGRDLLLDIDIRGALTFKRNFPDSTVIVFLVPPDPKTLRDRITGRAAISPDELETRLKTAREEYDTLFDSLRNGSKIDYVVINDDRARAYGVLASILKGERARAARLNPEDLKSICVID